MKCLSYCVFDFFRLVASCLIGKNIPFCGLTGMLFQQIEYGKQRTHKYNQFINSPGQPLEKGLIIIQIRLIWGQQDFVFPIRMLKPSS